MKRKIKRFSFLNFFRIGKKLKIKNKRGGGWIMERVVHEFEPVFDEHSKVLLLGSIPSIKSREMGFYYSHPMNRFWKVMSLLFCEDILDKKAFCLKHHIALWDTIASCEIHASSDASIRNVEVNDLSLILKVAPIQAIFTEGKKAHEIYQKYLFPIYQIEDICLSSTSSANARVSLEELVEEYRQILKYL